MHKIILALIALTLLPITSLQSTQWKAGVGSTCITPPEPMPMAGYASRGAMHATGKLHDLWAKSLLLEDSQGHRGLFISLDVCGIDAALSDRVCAKLKQNHGLERNQIAIATSHTHTGPVVAGNLSPMHYQLFDASNQMLVDRYANFLVDAIDSSVSQCFSDIQPSEVRYGSSSTDFAVNRRNNPEGDVPALRAAGKLRGPNDHSVPVLVVSRNTKPAAIVFGYACHCTTLSDMQWSGDYAGFAQIELENQYPGCTAMFWAGCGGDQNPLPRRTVDLASEYGKRLASAVKAAMNQTQMVAPKLSTTYTLTPVAFGPLPTREDLEKDRVSDNKYASARAQHWIRLLDAGKELPKDYQYPIGYWRLGEEVDWLFLGGEVVVDYSHKIKALKDAKRATWVTAYANDVMAYIPSQRVLAEGGYEGGGAMVYYGLPTIWSTEVEPLILQTAAQQLASP